MRRAVAAVAIALLVVTAGCAANSSATPTTAGDANNADDGAAETAADDGSADGTAAVDDEAGTVNFYVSDEPNDMDDFAHLNVTITSVRFHLADAAGDGSANGDANSTGDANASDDIDATDAVNATDAANATDDDESEGDGRWITRDVNATSVDLSKLRGANATLLEEFELPAGEYDKVFLDVGEINGTLTTNGSANVKLPSEKLHLNEQFTVANGSEVDFVYDVSVHRAGKSGKYVLKPVVGESGTDVPIERVDDENESDDDRSDDNRSDDRSLSAAFAGPVEPGENVTVRVTDGDGPVANATVSVDDGADGVTNADGEYVVSVPAEAAELDIDVELDDAEAELEWEREVGEDDEGEGGEGTDA